jgi:hypothetical protein
MLAAWHPNAHLATAGTGQSTQATDVLQHKGKYEKANRLGHLHITELCSVCTDAMPM